MLTRCPNCNTWFRIRPEHLQAASGEVQCGRCFTRFNALATLAEETGAEPPSEARAQQAPPAVEPVEADAATAAPAPPKEPAAEQGVDQAAVSETQAATVSAEAQQEAAQPLPEQREAGGELGDERKEPGVKWTAVEIEDDWRMDKLIGEAEIPPEIPPGKQESAKLGPPPLVELDLPLTLRGEGGRTAARKGRRRTVLWTLGALLLLVVLAAQYAYFHRTVLVAEYPQARPLVTRLCKRLGCTLPVRRDLAAIHILNRDVREHPNFAGTLLVNATIVNDAAFAQPYPTLQLSLFDSNGTLLGLRRFKPSEYLDGSIDLAAGMPPHSPVHVVLEVAGASDAATSFEFRFL